MPEIEITDNDIIIHDAYKFTKREFSKRLKELRAQYPTNSVLANRTDFSIKMEWAAHKILYWIGYQRSRTADADINYPFLEGENEKLYILIGLLGWLFV